MALLLKDAGTARTTSITLAGLEYADHLGKAMEDHADKVEKVYKEVQQALKTKNEKEIMKWIQKVETESANTKKPKPNHNLHPTNYIPRSPFFCNGKPHKGDAACQPCQLQAAEPQPPNGTWANHKIYTSQGWEGGTNCKSCNCPKPCLAAADSHWQQHQ